MGLNQLGQLGISRTMNQSLQPMLIKALNNKIITQICAGQHHNAVVADNKLYTWGFVATMNNGKQWFLMIHF